MIVFANCEDGNLYIRVQDNGEMIGRDETKIHSIPI